MPRTAAEPIRASMGSEDVAWKELPQPRTGPQTAKYPTGAGVDRFVQQFSAGVRFRRLQTLQRSAPRARRCDEVPQTRSLR